MESKAICKFQRVSPRKTRLVAQNIKGLPVEDALNQLKFTQASRCSLRSGSFGAGQRLPVPWH